MKPAKPDRRKALLARVHILAKELGMDDDAYRQALHDAFGVRSCRALNEGELIAFADGLTRLLPAAHPQRRAPTTDAGQGYPGRPRNIRPGPAETSRSAQLRKVEALLAEAKYPWSYADALARRICKVERMAFVPEHELYKIITALELDAKRHGRDTG